MKTPKSKTIQKAETTPQAVVLVYSTGHAIRGEKLLGKAGMASKLIPVPRHLSSDCGTCIRIKQEDREKAAKTLESGGVQYAGIVDL